MDNIKIYTILNCIYCKKAKDLLYKNKKLYKEILVNNKFLYEKMIFETNGKKTFPQIFFNDELIGGYDDLCKFFE